MPLGRARCAKLSSEAHGRSALDAIATVIGGGRTLLLLDNMEHARDSAADIAELVSRCSGVCVITTSRAPLAIGIEHELAVPTLAVPDMHVIHVDALLPATAVELFVQRAVKAQPAFALTTANRADVAAICLRLDGLPLALELAAARLRLFEPAALRQQLDDAIDLPTADDHDVPARQRTLRATIAWSDSLLSTAEQQLLRSLSVFADGWALAAMEAVCYAEADQWRARDELRALVDHGLVRVVDAGARYALLEPIRAFAADSLKERGEAESVQRAHAMVFLAYADDVQAGITGTTQLAALQRARRDDANMRAAIRWFTAQALLGLLAHVRGQLAQFDQHLIRCPLLADLIDHHRAIQPAVVGDLAERGQQRVNGVVHPHAVRRPARVRQEQRLFPRLHHHVERHGQERESEARLFAQRAFIDKGDRIARFAPAFRQHRGNDFNPVGEYARCPPVEDHLKLNRGGDLGPNLIRPGHHLFQMAHPENLQLQADKSGAGVHLQMETDHRAEEARSRTPRRPEQFRIFLFAGMNQGSIGQHDIDPDHALAGQAVGPAVPAESALQQEPAHADGIGMRHREEEAPFGQRGIQLAEQRLLRRIRHLRQHQKAVLPAAPQADREHPVARPDAVRAEVDSPTYEGALLDRDGVVMVNPARLAWGLRDACLQLGVRIHEGTRATGFADAAGAGQAAVSTLFSLIFTLPPGYPRREEPPRIEIEGPLGGADDPHRVAMRAESNPCPASTARALVRLPARHKARPISSRAFNQLSCPIVSSPPAMRGVAGPDNNV